MMLNDAQERTLLLDNLMQCNAVFDNMESLYKGYYNIINSTHEEYITKINSKLEEKHFFININMGVEEIDYGRMLPLIGEV